MFHHVSLPSRRLHSRIFLVQNVWICWLCVGRDDVSPLRDLSLGGLFLATRKIRSVGTPIKVDFLVQEGLIRADALVVHRVTDRGWGLKFTVVTEQDRPRFAALLRRLRDYALEPQQAITA